MNIMAEVQLLAQAGKPREGIALVERAAADSDTEALLILAHWRLWGLYGPRDPAAAHALLGRAANAGSGEAGLLRATMVGNGTGVPSDPAAARALLEGLAATEPLAAEQLALLDRMDERPSDEEILSADPDVGLVRGFLSADECRYLIGKATPRLRPSMIIDPQAGRPRPDPVRTSAGMNFDPANEDLVIHAINRRIAAVTGSDVIAGEPLHVLRYETGQEFRPHLDAFANADNQREWTALTYLNEGYEGGETVFPDIGVTVIGRPGDCLIFRVSSPDGVADLRLRHAGRPVTQGVKWLASRWIRQRPYIPEILPSAR